jgi:hypothetical protein
MRCLLTVYYDLADHCIGVYLMLFLLATLILYTRLPGHRWADGALRYLTRRFGSVF